MGGKPRAKRGRVLWAVWTRNAWGLTDRVELFASRPRAAGHGMWDGDWKGDMSDRRWTALGGPDLTPGVPVRVRVCIEREDD